ncbi:MAG: flagellar basal body rod protein FlgC [Gemmobacter sp.]|nr:flagellar basal body rod protein FlgC [Gemmobacter sp.]
MDELSAIRKIASSGIRAQGERMRVISENIANADATGRTPGADPYRRKTISFSEMVERESGVALVRADPPGRDMSAFPVRFDPSHPAADAQGFVKTPNVSAIIEMANMREAQRSYEANMNMFETGRKMRSLMLDMLK